MESGCHYTGLSPKGKLRQEARDQPFLLSRTMPEATATASRKCLGEAWWPSAQEDKSFGALVRFSFQQHLSHGQKEGSKLLGCSWTLSGLEKEAGGASREGRWHNATVGPNTQRCSSQASLTDSWLQVEVFTLS